MDSFFTWLGNIANVLSLITLLFSILTYFKVKKETRKLTESLAQVPSLKDISEHINFSANINSPRPVALAFSLTPTGSSIKPPVQNFLNAKNRKMPVEEIQMNGISIDNIQDFYKQVCGKKLELELKEYTEVHLFFNGPVQAATIVGCLFSNWMPVKLYHRPQGSSSYEYWMPLIKI